MHLYLTLELIEVDVSVLNLVPFVSFAYYVFSSSLFVAVYWDFLDNLVIIIKCLFSK